jgi:hypothetical protein
MQQTQGGFESEIFVTPPGEMFDCTLCLMVLRMPQQCKNGHAFCLSCITVALDRVKSCPICSCDLDLRTLAANRLVKDMIDALPAQCSSNDIPNQTTLVPKCSWIGSLSSRKKHFDEECGHFPIQCSHKFCVEFLHRGTIADHQRQCEHRPESCPCCDRSCPRSCLENHLRVCGQRHVSCSNHCGETLPFNSLHQHKATDCAVEPVECPFFSIGMCIDTCSQSLPRHELDFHVSQLSPHRVLTLAEKFNGAQRQNEEFRQSLILEQSISEGLLKNIVVLVEFAGVRVCNGHYKYKSLKNNAGVFERRGLLRGTPSRFVIHKVMVTSNAACWYLSVLPRHSELTDCHSVCWYRSNAISVKDSLPNNYWTHGVSVLSIPPRVTVRFVDLVNFGNEDEDEGEDEDDTIYMVDSSVSGDEEEMDEGEKEEEGDDQMV